MSNTETIIVALRETVGKAASRELRKSGFIPATIYGLGEAVVSVAISPKIVARILASDTGMNSMIHMQREGTDIQRHAIIKDLQRDPVTGRLSHVDFMRVDPTHKVKVQVPIILKGIPAGVKEGGILDFVHRYIEIECLPALIPAHVEVNVDRLMVGDVIRVDQIELDSHLTVLGDPRNVICSVQGAMAEEEVAPVVAAEAPAAEGAVKEAEAAPAKGKKDDKK